MPSASYRRWTTTRAKELDEVEQAHAAIGGTGPGRRTTTQQVNRAYAVLLASQFQGFCRDLHTESVDALTRSVTPTALQAVLRDELTRHRSLDRGNAHAGTIGADFGRLGLPFWATAIARDPRNDARKDAIDQMNEWRNMIVHQDFSRLKGARDRLLLREVRGWRESCNQLARSFDTVIRSHLTDLTGSPPW